MRLQSNGDYITLYSTRVNYGKDRFLYLSGQHIALVTLCIKTIYPTHQTHKLIFHDKNRPRMSVSTDKLQLHKRKAILSDRGKFV